MKLLKIGTLNLPRNRWLDALECFERVYVFCWDFEYELDNEKFVYIKIPAATFLNKCCKLFIAKTNSKKFFFLLQKVWICFFRIINKKYIKQIPFNEIDYFHSSYNDFDESNLFTLVLPKKLKITRAQKETRVENNNLEYACMRRCERIILNDIECKKFFEQKYGDTFFDGKEVVLNLDEDVRYSKLADTIEYSSKLSENDGKIHAVILAGRVLSDKKDKRSGGRLYYLDIINDLLEAGIVVHLHTRTIIPFCGKNPYEVLAMENKNFIIEPPLDFEGDPKNAYRILSRYDIGILHAYITTEQVTLFDRVNIPHRYYEYLLGHVCPIVPKDKSAVIEKLFKERQSGLIYESLFDITLDKLQVIHYENVFFKDYFLNLYK